MILETNRLYLKEFSVDDAEGLWLLNSEEEVLRFTGDEPFESVAAAKQFIEEYDEYRRSGFGRWTVRTNYDDSYVGWCGLKRLPDDDVDLGFRLLRSQWNKGYGTEAAHACLNYGFDHLGLDRIIGRAMVANGASIRVLEKIGMSYWKEEESPGLGKTVFLQMTKSQFRLLDL